MSADPTWDFLAALAFGVAILSGFSFACHFALWLSLRDLRRELREKK